MNTAHILQFVIFLILLLALTKPLGVYMVKVFSREKTFLDPVLRPIERGIYKICFIQDNQEQGWKSYAASIIVFSFFGILLLYLILRLQQWLPLNPQHFQGMSPTLAFNTAISFATNTDWQAYSGESSLSYFSQMAGLAVQNFFSAATGIAVVIALIRGLARNEKKTIGNFWVDFTRAILWILLPLSILIGLIYVFQGVPQNLSHYIHATTLEGKDQLISLGPVASQEAIKSIGTNGGGFFNANSAYPYENPTGFTNFLQMLSIFLIGSGLTYTFGRMVKKQRQGWTLLAAMLVLFTLSWGAMQYAEMHPNPKVATMGAQVTPTALQSGGNMEGKEARFGVAASTLYDSVSTAASDGGVNSMLDSYTPIGGGMALFNMMLGELIVGGVGAGLYTMLMYVLIAVFIAGLMIGRTPQFLGKKIAAQEMKWTMFAVLVSPILMLTFTAIAAAYPTALQSLSNAGPHGFTQVLYAFTSAAANNGSAFAGLNANTNFFNVSLGVAMYIGRFFMIVPILAVAGLLAAKKRTAEEAEALPTTGLLFAGILVGVIILLAGLEFLPALALGPIAEHLDMLRGVLF